MEVGFPKEFLLLLVPYLFHDASAVSALARTCKGNLKGVYFYAQILFKIKSPRELKLEAEKSESERTLERLAASFRNYEIPFPKDPFLMMQMSKIRLFVNVKKRAWTLNLQKYMDEVAFVPGNVLGDGIITEAFPITEILFDAQLKSLLYPTVDEEERENLKMLASLVLNDYTLYQRQKIRVTEMDAIMNFRISLQYYSNIEKDDPRILLNEIADLATSSNDLESELAFYFRHITSEQDMILESQEIFRAIVPGILSVENILAFHILEWADRIGADQAGPRIQRMIDLDFFHAFDVEEALRSSNDYSLFDVAYPNWSELEEDIEGENGNFPFFLCDILIEIRDLSHVATSFWIRAFRECPRWKDPIYLSVHPVLAEYIQPYRELVDKLTKSYRTRR